MPGIVPFESARHRARDVLANHRREIVPLCKQPPFRPPPHLFVGCRLGATIRLRRDSSSHRTVFESVGGRRDAPVMHSARFRFGDRGRSPVSSMHVARSASLHLPMRRHTEPRQTRESLPTKRLLVARIAYEHGLVGARFWGQVRGFSGRLRVLRGRGAASGETGRIAGKALC